MPAISGQTPQVSVAICAHNSAPDVLQLTLDALRRQDLPLQSWELIVVDNNSSPPLDDNLVRWHPQGRRIVEPELGLTPARLRAMRESRASLLVLVDDDNRLASDYLSRALALANDEPEVGAWGGRVIPEFASPPEPWMKEFLPMLALRDLGAAPIRLQPPQDDQQVEFTTAAPLGAGMVIRREAFQVYANAVCTASSHRRGLDRRGQTLSSGGDNDLVLSTLRAGWAVAYNPELVLSHFIPSQRLHARYLGRLRRGIFRSWVIVRALHGLPVPQPIPTWRAWLLKQLAWIEWRAWRGQAAWVHWMGQCGDFEGRADLGTLRRQKSVAT